MPSSVFRCISVFQVYFGVYTDRHWPDDWGGGSRGQRPTRDRDVTPQFGFPCRVRFTV